MIQLLASKIHWNGSVSIFLYKLFYIFYKKEGKRSLSFQACAIPEAYKDTLKEVPNYHTNLHILNSSRREITGICKNIQIFF